ncbi:CLUMA_CG013880, isoform A [Clunio marinus]|uniref:Protein neuralized n=1 Tax=Clunio marinus TaxID=568069 RepID=A0A1J1IM30_9DIPT|nr:CLUMA_CG013880, isoform A [Clunio marinus]
MINDYILLFFFHFPAPRSHTSCPSPNNLPPLQFHNVHGDNIRISRDGKIARRYESFCKGITFSARPVKVQERVCVRFAEISNNWSGVIRFGFTCMDPTSLEGTLPKYACPDLTNKPGFWGKALHERFCQRDNVLFYYVSSSGEVHYGINGEEKGLFITDVDTRGPLWAMIDIYGNSTACEFLDSRTYMCNNNMNVQQPNRQLMPLPSIPTQDIYDINERIQNVNLSVEAVNRRQTIHSSNNLLNQNVINGYQPMQLHPLIGRNVVLTQDRTIATRVDNEFCQGYVFTQRPIKYGEQFIIQILKNDSLYGGSLALGLTSCNPNSLISSDLPDDADVLLDRPEYWVVSKDIGQIVQLSRGDEIKFSVLMSGEVQISRNDNAPITLMYVDQSLQLWAFFDVYGSTQGIRVLSKHAQMPPAYQQPPQPLSIQKALNASVPLNHRVMPAQAQVPNEANLSSRSVGTTTSIISGTPNGDIQVQSSGTVLVVNLPPAPPAPVKSSSSQPTMIRGRSATRVSESSTSLYAAVPCKKQQNAPFVDAHGTVYGTVSNYGPNDPSNGVDCTICYENPIDSVLYMCGHMCMCYDCAMKHWRGGINGGACPLCRAPIRDVIRTYKS